ncbi:MAG TPA: hypothetical protein VID47_08005 [Actinomycetota bacterium]|jgi:hypothetical protein
MGERTILVCDVCGRPAVQSVTIKVGRQNWTKDLCQVHVDELTAGARKPRPGRRRAVVAAGDAVGAPRRRGRPPKSASAGGPPKRRGRPPKARTETGASESSA